MIEAAYYQQRDDLLSCQLCPNLCLIGVGQRGACHSRIAKDGRLWAENYAITVAENLDPIEKKPLYHLCPGKMVYSVGSYGCNLHCRFCQNADISQQIQPGIKVLPEQLVKKAGSFKDNIGVAFTYNEPGIWYEYIRDCAPLLRHANLLTIMVTNGYLSTQPWNDLCQVVDAMNIDIKSFNPDFYKNICGGKLEQVKENITAALNANVHVELTHLVVTGLNDDKEEFSKLVSWVAALGKDIPLHISRYFPKYHEKAQATAPATITDFVAIAREKLNFVYPGNLAADQSTHCPDCKKIWVSRSQHETQVIQQKSLCECGRLLPFRNHPKTVAPTV